PLAVREDELPEVGIRREGEPPPLQVAEGLPDAALEVVRLVLVGGLEVLLELLAAVAEVDAGDPGPGVLRERSHCRVSCGGQPTLTNSPPTPFQFRYNSASGKERRTCILSTQVLVPQGAEERTRTSTPLTGTRS